MQTIRVKDEGRKTSPMRLKDVSDTISTPAGQKKGSTLLFEDKDIPQRPDDLYAHSRDNHLMHTIRVKDEGTKTSALRLNDVSDTISTSAGQKKGSTFLLEDEDTPQRPDDLYAHSRENHIIDLCSPDKPEIINLCTPNNYKGTYSHSKVDSRKFTQEMSSSSSAERVLIFDIPRKIVENKINQIKRRRR